MLRAVLSLSGLTSISFTTVYNTFSKKLGTNILRQRYPGVVHSRELTVVVGAFAHAFDSPWPEESVFMDFF